MTTTTNVNEGDFNTQMFWCLNPWTFIPIYRKTAVIVTGPRHGHASCRVQTQPHLQVEHRVLIQLSKGGKLPRPAGSGWSCGHNALCHVSWEQEVRGYVQNSSLQLRYVRWITSPNRNYHVPSTVSGYIQCLWAMLRHWQYKEIIM